MAASKIELTPAGLKVPDEVIIPCIPGDGTGPDIWAAAAPVLQTAVERAYGGRRRIEFVTYPAGETAYQELGTPLPEETVAAIAEHHVAIKGPLTTPVGGGFRSVNVAIRQALDLYACIRPVRYFDGLPSPLKDPRPIDIVVFRENTEDVYSGLEWPAGSDEAERLSRFVKDELGSEIRPGSGIGLKPISKFASQRLVSAAIDYALAEGRPSVTLVHKGNIMKFTEGAFRDWGYQIAAEKYGRQTVPESKLGDSPPNGRVVINDRIADMMFQQVILRPGEYSVLATPNLNGDYLSDALAALIGGLGIAPGANVGDTAAVFEATHGSAPKYAGQDKVNPSSVILSGEMMLRHLGWTEAAERVSRAVAGAIAAKTVTYDLARLMDGAKEVSCSEFGRLVRERL